MAEPLTVALVGCGRMGARHAAIAAAHPGCRLVAVVDPVVARAQALAVRFGAPVVAEVPRGVDAAIVAVPATRHAEVAFPLLARGVRCLVEKPLASDPAAARALADTGRVAVGHVERYNPVFLACPLDRAPGLRVEVRREVPSDGRAADVDALLDLAVHDLDLLLRIGELAVARVAGSDPAETGFETVDAELEGDGWSVGLRISRRSGAAARTWRVTGPSGPWLLDLAARTATRDGRPIAVPAVDPLQAQWSAFVAWVNGSGPPPTSGGDAAAAVALAARLATAAREVARA